ncbi:MULTISPECIES: aminoglycoside 6-adenylyltransferase [unclassified Clostridioides]
MSSRNHIVNEFICDCNNFLCCLNNVAKGIWREEVSYAMDMINYYITSLV